MKKLFLLLLCTLFILPLTAQQVDLIEVQASKMNKKVKNNVIKPENYSASVKYPVVYLLHGFGGNHNDWPSIVPKIKKLATLHQMIIVCPDGANSWYMDSPVNTESQYETYIVKDLIGYIDANYSTVVHKNGRSVIGLSMGGHGAFHLAINNQDVFRTVGALSGGVDLTKSSQQFALSDILGEYTSNKERWEKASIVGQVDKLKNGQLNIFFDCGNKDMFFASNEELHAKLVAKGIDHDYTSRPGDHNWEYWTDAINYQLLYSKLSFDRLATTEYPGGKIFFYDSSASDKYDPSWANVTEPSLLPELAAGKFVVDNNIKYSGENSLRMRWNSKEGGNWKACFAAKNWQLQDLSRVLEVRFWVYTQTEIANNALPLVYFEANGGTLTSKQKMGKYINGYLKANTWTEVIIPVTDLLEGAPNYNAKISKTLFFAQDLADNVEHTLYIDQVVLMDDPNYQPPTTIQLFDDSADNLFYDPSWINVTSPSIVEQPEGKASKFPVELVEKYKGDNALRLTYTSAAGGNWVALVAGKGWAPFDVSSTDLYELRFFVKSPTVISGNILPKLYFEGVGGGVTGKLLMKNYVSELKANTWTEVVIPITDFEEVDPAFAKWATVKGIFFAQNDADGISHTLYLDDMRFEKKGSGTAIHSTKIDGSKVYYRDGVLFFSTAVGKTDIVDVTGKVIKKMDITDTDLLQNIALPNGVYLVRTQTGTFKIMVQ